MVIKIKKRRGLLPVVFAVIMIFLSLYLNYQHAWNLDKEHIGLFGDLFGASNALFSGLAFIGIIYTIFLQSEELSLQRKELAETRMEFSEQNATMKLQSFENTFFKLLESQNQIRQIIINQSTSDSNGKVTSKFESLYYDYKYSRERIVLEYLNNAYLRDKKGLTFDEFLIKYHHISEIQLNEDPLNAAYLFFFYKNEDNLGNYFRHNFQILKFIYENERREVAELALELAASDIPSSQHAAELQKNEQNVRAKYQKYADFIQAQMSAYEMIIYFYNGLSFPKAKKYSMYYRIIENISGRLLIDNDDTARYLAPDHIDNIEISPLKFRFMN